jgi:hypothetical protein
MAKKTVGVSGHKRSTPSTPAYKSSGNKPGPKSVSVTGYKRTTPKN